MAKIRKATLLEQVISVEIEKQEVTNRVNTNCQGLQKDRVMNEGSIILDEEIQSGKIENIQLQCPNAHKRIGQKSVCEYPDILK